MLGLKRHSYALIDFLREALLVFELWLPELQSRARRPEVPVIASLTSYPPRIRFAWIAIETLLRQSVKPKRLFLVLNEQEFPGRSVPRKIRAQTRRGLEILWTGENGRSYDKLIPVHQEFPRDTIVTFDDDKFFPHQLLHKLYQGSIAHPKAVIGSRGWVISFAHNGLHYGSAWVRAHEGAKGRALLTPGGNGCLYPPDSMDQSVDNLQKALEICPTADDIWFWGAIQKAGTSLVCLGLPAHRPIRAMKSTQALSDTNATANDSQFQRVLDFWDIRETITPLIVQAREFDD